MVVEEEEEEKRSDFVTQQSGALGKRAPFFFSGSNETKIPALPRLCLCGFSAVTTSLAFLANCVSALLCVAFVRPPEIPSGQSQMTWD